MKSRVLIVGGSGYVGRHLLKAVSGIYEVTFTGMELYSPEDNYCRVLYEDEKTFDAISSMKFDIAIILAAKLSSLDTTSLTHPDLYSNTLAYAKFLEYLGEHKLVKQMIYVSSMSVYSTKNSLPVQEDGIVDPFHTYGLSKHIAERISSFFCMHNPIKGLILRIPGVYGGERKSGYIYNCIVKCASNDPLRLNTQNLVFWEAINVNDLCRMIIKLLDTYQWEKDIDVFNVSYGEECDFYKTAYFIKESLNSKSEIIEEDSKGYIPFYLSNRKLSSIINITETYKPSLLTYIREVVG